MKGEQCDYAKHSETTQRCENIATKKWGDNWFCDIHGDRKIKTELSAEDQKRLGFNILLDYSEGGMVENSYAVMGASWSPD